MMASSVLCQNAHILQTGRRALFGLRIVRSRAQNRQARAQSPKEGDENYRHPQQSPPQMLPNLDESRRGFDLGPVESRPVGELPDDEVHAEHRADPEAAQGQGQLSVANGVAGYQGARTRQGEIGSQASPGRL